MRFASTTLCFCGGLLAFSLTACSSNNSAQSADHGLDSGTSDAASVTCSSSDSVDLQGRWALIAKFSLRLRSQIGGMVTMCPVDQQGEAMMSFLVDISRDPTTPNAYSIHANTCSLNLPTLTAMAGTCDPAASGLLSVGILVPDLLTNVLPIIEEAPAKAHLEGSSPSSAFLSDALTFTFGGRSDRPNLPSWLIDRKNCGPYDFALGHTANCESACVDDCGATFDDDHNDYPGVSVDVCGYTQDDLSTKVICRSDKPNQAGSTLQGRMAMVFRAALSLVGNARSSCEITGTFDSTTIYSVLGADAYLTNTNIPVASVIKSLPLFDADPKNSRFRLVRIDGLHGAPDYNLVGRTPPDACSVIRSHKNDLL